MTTRFYTTIKYYFINALQTQLIITVVAMPILVAWGMGTSLATFIGNIIFTPLLGIFLMLSSMLFFTELCGIPNGILIYLLEQLTAWWDGMLACGQPCWLFTCAYPGMWPLAISIVVALWCIQHRKLNSVLKKSMCMAGFIIGIGGSLWLFTLYQQYSQRNIVTVFDREGKTPALQGSLTYAIIDGRRCIVDQGFYARKKSTDHAILFELKPYLITTIGSASVDALIITKPSLGSFQAATALCSYCGVKTLFVAYTKAPVCKHAWKVFYDLSRFAKANGIALHRLYLSSGQLNAVDATALAKKCLALHEI